jgi:hypothetical protein
LVFITHPTADDQIFLRFLSPIALEDAWVTGKRISKAVPSPFVLLT